MAGYGSRFAEQGYELPKPLIDVLGKPMISWVVDNVRCRMANKFTFICLEEHCEQYEVESLLKALVVQPNIVKVPSVTQGAACTVLLASDFFNGDNPLLLANSDQLVDLNINLFIEDAIERNLDGSILTFEANHPKWSYAAIDSNGFVTKVAEKDPISPHATVGIYYFKYGKSFFEGAVSMIEKDIRVKSEFYVCPVFNWLIGQGMKIGIYEIPSSAMHGVGTPEDLKIFEELQRIQQH